MGNTALNRTTVLQLTNSSGGLVVQGDVVILHSSSPSAFTTTTSAAFTDAQIGVVLDLAGIADGSIGLVAFAGWVPKINLDSSASIRSFVTTSTTVKKGAPVSTMQAGVFAQVLETGTSPEAILLGSTIQGIGGTSPSYACIADVKAAGTDGGTFTSGAWRTRTLNTELFDPHGIVSISANQFTLASGTYWIKAVAPALAVDGHQARLRNITAGTTVAYGTSQYDDSTGLGNNDHSIIFAGFTISSGVAFEIQHYCQTTGTGSGFGTNCGVPANQEVYTIVEITKEA